MSTNRTDSADFRRLDLNTLKIGDRVWFAPYWNRLDLIEGTIVRVKAGYVSVRSSKGITYTRQNIYMRKGKRRD